MVKFNMDNYMEVFNTLNFRPKQEDQPSLDNIDKVIACTKKSEYEPYQIIGEISLCSPFSFLGGSINSHNRNNIITYQGIIRIKTNYLVTDMPEVYSAIESELKKADLKSVNTGNNSIYVMSDAHKIDFLICSQLFLSAQLDISFGSNGTRKRIISSPEQLEEDMIRLGKICDAVVNNPYKNKNSKLDIEYELI